jgi:hypothetical protein
MQSKSEGAAQGRMEEMEKVAVRPGMHVKTDTLANVAKRGRKREK